MRRRATSAFILFLATVVSTTVIVACGGGNDSAEGANEPPAGRSTPGVTATSPASAPNADNGAVVVSMVDFSYEPARLDARAGQEVRLTVRNDGLTPHTFTITDVVDSGIVAAGETQVVVFTPKNAGSLTFFCAVHGVALMSGQLTVAP
jgi:plastocyanin